MQHFISSLLLKVTFADCFACFDCFHTPVFKTGRIVVYHCPSVCPFHMSRSNLRTPWPIHFKFHRVIGIDGLTVCILYGEISNFHSKVMGLYSSNCRPFFICCAVNWEPLIQFTSNFAQLLELIVLRSGYFLVKFRFFIQELWERKSLQILYECIDANHYDFSVIVANFGTKLRCYGQQSTCYGFPIIAGPEPFPI